MFDFSDSLKKIAAGKITQIDQHNHDVEGGNNDKNEEIVSNKNGDRND